MKYALGLLLATMSLTALAVEGDPNSPGLLPKYENEIESIKQNAKVQAAFAHVEAIEPDTIADMIELTEIPAPPFGEETRSAHYAEMLRAHGLTDVWLDEVGNAIGRLPGTKGDRVIAFNAHIDTVFPIETDVKVRYRDGRYYAPGIGDNSRGLAAILAVLKAIKHAGIQTEADILFIGNVGEEGLGDLRGVKHLFRDGAEEKIDTMLVVDGGRSDRIVYGGVGSHRYRVTFKGPGGHSWGAFGLANPHHALGRAIAIFDQNATKVTSAEGEKTSYSIGRIGGGTSINSIPFESWMEVDMRSGDQSRLDDIDAVFQAAMQQALEEENEGRLEGPALTVDVKRVGTRPAGRGEVQSPLVQRAIAASKTMGYEPSLALASTDANLPISKGVPSVTMSRGGIGDGAHSLDEWWANEDGHLGIQALILALLAEAVLVE